METADSIRRTQMYLDILHEGEELKKKINLNPGVENVAEIRRLVERSSELDKEFQTKKQEPNASEICVSTAVGKLEHELLAPIVQKLGSSSFSAHDYALSINNKTNEDGQQRWDAIENIACRLSKASKFSACLLGSFDHVPFVAEKVAKERRKPTKSVLGKEEKLETVKSLEKTDKGAIKVNEIQKQIIQIYKNNDSKPIPYYPLVVDPTDFMHTVENAFHIAFLARDGTLIIDLSDDGAPTVRLPTSEEKRIPSSDVALQKISSLNKTFCQEIVRKYNIRKPMLTSNKDQVSESQSSSQQASTSRRS